MKILNFLHSLKNGWLSLWTLDNYCLTFLSSKKVSFFYEIVQLTLFNNIGHLYFKQNMLFQNFLTYFCWHVLGVMKYAIYMFSHSVCLIKWMSDLGSSLAQTQQWLQSKRWDNFFFSFFSNIIIDLNLQERTTLRLPSCTLSVGKTGNRWNWK